MSKRIGRKARGIEGPRGRKKQQKKQGRVLETPFKVTEPHLVTPFDPRLHENLADRPLTIVGIGASAGGLEACSALFGALPEDTGMALVLVQHLAPQHPSMLPELLASSTHLEVFQAADGMSVVANKVYVIPPNVHMRMEDGKLRLLPRPEDHSQFMPIDFFLRSLAEHSQSRAIGIILSGTASDGAMGLREIKGVGGITMVQDPKSARYDGMPRAAIATGQVDLVLGPKEIAQELERLSRHPFVRHVRLRSAGDNLGLVDDHYVKILQILRTSTGVDFTHYKQPTIKRRLQRRMVINKISSTEQYIRFLLEKPAEVLGLYQDILIHVTRFFREPHSFEALAQSVFPTLIEKRIDGPIRVWVPGCSTGEEAYSVAIALTEFVESRSESVPIQIFGTDISETAVNQARSGVYSESVSGDLSPARLRRFFTKFDGHYRISKEIRDLCVFARQDLTRDPPFSKLDLILCRNVLIYLEPILQKKLLGVFNYALKQTGFLMLGSAETTGPHADLFSLVEKRHKIYLKKVVTHRAEMDFSTDRQQDDEKGAAKKAPLMNRGARDVQGEASQVLLTRYAPPGVIVDSDMEIVQFRGQTGAFLEPSPGDASLNLFKMAREGLLFGLRSAVYEARKGNSVVRREGLRIKVDGQVQVVSLEVIPLQTSPRRHLLVLFESPGLDEARKEAARQGEAAPPRKDHEGAKSGRSEGSLVVRRLEEELAASREYLQSIIQDLEAANEELQSANEEILSANEELQSTNEELDTAKEELQSTNEELNTVNEELHGRNDELSRANSDLINLLGSVQIAIVMVSSDLRIRRFTPVAEKILNLIGTDVGRPISDIKPNIDCPDLEKLIGEAVDTVTIQEREVRDHHGNTYFLRIRPYKNLENRIEGAVLSLYDISASKVERDQAEIIHSYAEAMLDTVGQPLVIIDPQLRVKKVNRAFCDLFRISVLDAEGRPFHELGDGRWNSAALREALEGVAADKRRLDGFPIQIELPGRTGDGRKELVLTARPLGDGRKPEDLILISLSRNEGEGSDEASGRRR
jgi:two-component system, chemotaxis family, CheB/CheR fusion protein